MPTSVRPLRLIRDMSNTRIVKQYASAHHLVYFGSVDPSDDEHEVIRGVTASAQHRDQHYTVGTVDGRDIIVVWRRNRLTFPNKSAHDYSWLIMQVDLRRAGLPHIFIDAKRHEDVFYANLSIALPQVQDITGLLPQSAGKHWRVFCPQTDVEMALPLLHDDITATLESFRQFDFEINDDILLVYARANQIQRVVLDDMTRVGLWLANALDA